MKQEPELIGGKFLAAGAITLQIVLNLFDPIFALAAPAIFVFVDPFRATVYIICPS